jgi:V/A-type H+-transporting ATPase subunit E
VNRSEDTRSDQVLRDEILADAQRQAQRLVRKARREADALVAKANEESEQERDRRLGAAQEAAERTRRLALATVPVETGRMQAARVERELQSLRDQIRERLLKRQGLDYGDLLVALAAEPLARMEGSAFVLELSPDDLRDYGRELAAAVAARAGRPNIRLTVADTPVKIQGGVIVRDAPGRQIWDNSLESRLDRMWPMLRSQLAAHLGFDTGTETEGGQP